MENVRINGQRVSDENEIGKQEWRRGKGGKDLGEEKKKHAEKKEQ